MKKTLQNWTITSIAYMVAAAVMAIAAAKEASGLTLQAMQHFLSD